MRPSYSVSRDVHSHEQDDLGGPSLGHGKHLRLWDFSESPRSQFPKESEVPLSSLVRILDTSA